MSRKICVITGTRAEFGLMRWLMQEIQGEPGLELQVIATGMHLSPEFGLTYREGEQAGLSIDATSATIAFLYSSKPGGGGSWTVVTADKSLAAHFEHSITITEHGGPEILTRQD